MDMNKKTPLLLALEKLNRPTNKLVIPRDFVKFCQMMPLENGRYFSFDGREFLYDICRDDSKQICILKARQVGMTTWILAKIIHNALVHPKTVSLYVTDSIDHAVKFSQDRLDVILEQFGISRHVSEKKISRAKFPNGSVVYVISGYNKFKQARSIPADFIYLDECQSTELDALANLKEAMSQSPHKKIIITGTGSFEGSSWHKFYQNTNNMQWKDGKWNALSDGNSGYRISQSMMPNITKQELEDKRKEYPSMVYQMEVLGEFASGNEIPLPYSLVIKSYDDNIQLLTPSELSGKLIATIDWGGSLEGAYTVLTISQIDGENIRIVHLEKFHISDVIGLGTKVADRLDEYNIENVFCDIGGNTGAMQIVESKRKIFKIALGEHPKSPITVNEDTDVISVDKSTYLQRVVSWFESGKIKIPLNEDTEWSIDHLTSETARIVTKSTGGSVIRYELLPNRHDDFLQTLGFLAVALDDESPTNYKYYSVIV